MAMRVEGASGAKCGGCGGITFLLMQSDSQSTGDKPGRSYMLLMCSKSGCGQTAEIVVDSFRWLPGKVELVR